MSAGPGSARRGAGTAALLVVVIALSFQTGSALAVKVIDSVGIVEALWLRTALAALILFCVRPRSLRLPPRGQRLPLAALTLALLGMNASFYGAISHAPVGLVVAIEFVGPLAVAVIGSRRPLDYLWIVLAGAGVVVLGGPSSSVSGLGLALSLLAAFFWAAYLLLAKRTLRDMDPLPVTTLMLAGSAVLLTPLLLATGPQIAGHAGRSRARRARGRALVGLPLLPRVRGPAPGAGRHLRRAAQHRAGGRGADRLPHPVAAAHPHSRSRR